MRQSGFEEVFDLRQSVAQIVSDRPVPRAVEQAARSMIRQMLQEASRYGLTQADVLKAVLRSVFETKRGCDCPSCRARRSDAGAQSVGLMTLE